MNDDLDFMEMDSMERNENFIAREFDRIEKYANDLLGGW